MTRALLASGDIDQIADKCTAIANEVADETGFVPVRRLLSRFHARLFIRPLLVEGMLASLPDSARISSDKARWAILVDEESYRVGTDDLEAEGRGRALPTRLRNTIAHELTHTFAFQPSELGIKLRAELNSDTSRGGLLHEIERHTERLSPLLLWPEKAIAAVLEKKDAGLSIADLLYAREGMGISRELVITRLCLLKQSDPNRFLYSRGLKNLAIGLAEWGTGRLAAIKGRPLFHNFDGNTAPAFIHKLLGRDHVWANELFDAEDFVMCGGARTSVELATGAGTAESPNAIKMKIQVSVEDRERKPGRPFLFVAHGKIDHTK